MGSAMQLEPAVQARELFMPPPEVMKWLYSGLSRVTGMDGATKLRVPRRLAQRPRTGSSTSLVSLFNTQGGMCCYCTQDMTLPPALHSHRKKWPTDALMVEMEKPRGPALPPMPLHPLTEVTRDHLLPKSQGGPGLLSNFAAACRLCNQEKGDLPLVIFLLARSTNKVREFQRQQPHIRLALQAAKAV